MDYLLNKESVWVKVAFIAAGIALALSLALVVSKAQAQTTAVSCTFTRSLFKGVRGNDVTCLQRWLNNLSGTTYDVAISGPGSPGNETTYYGGKTKIAVAKWQAANGVSPAAGYFGRLSQAKYSAMASTGGGAMMGTTGGGVVVPVVPTAVAGGLSVAIDPATDSSRTIVAGAANMKFARFDFTASATGDVTVTTLKLTRTGIASDAELGNAYLFDSANGNYISQYSGLGSGVLTFANSGGLFTVKAGTTRVIQVRLDVASGASNNHTMAWTVNAATDVVSNATGVSGTFPIAGNAMTFVTVSNPSIATLTSASVGTGSSVNAGTTGYLAGSFTLQSGNSAVWLDRLVLTQNGSLVSNNDIANIKLVTTGGVQLGATLANLNSDGTGAFDLSAAPYSIPSGQTIQVNAYVDVMSGVNRTLKLNVLNLRDLQARDATYNVGINMSASVAMTQTTVQAGSLTVTIDPTSPTGNLAPGATNVTVAKFKVTAYGEQIKVLFVPVKIVMAAGGTNFQSNVNNVYLVDDAGNQIGTTLNGTNVSGATGTSGTWSDGDTVAATFGTLAANINYLIPANTTRIWSLKSDIKAGTGATNLQASLNGGTSNYQGQVSLSSANLTSVSGNTLTLASNPFQAVLNSAMGSVSVVMNQSKARIGSFVFSASSAEGIRISTITITSSTTFPFANLYANVNGVQFGTVTGSVAAATDYTFAGNTPVTIAAGGTVTVDIYSDILSSATNLGGSFYVKLKDSSATGAVTATTQTLKNGSVALTTINLNGQGVTINTSGGTITVAPDASKPAAYQIVMGKTQNTVGIWRFTGASTENVNINTMVIVDKVGAAGNKASFANLQWYQGGVAFGPVVAAGTASGTAGSELGYYYTFNFTSPIVIPLNAGISLELRGDTNTKASGGATSNSTHTWSFNPANAYITAVGAGSSLTAIVNDNGSNLLATSSASAVTNFGQTGRTTTDDNAVTIVRTKLTVTSDPTGIPIASHVTSANDIMAVWVFTADPGYDVTISTVTMKLAGATLATIPVQLIDNDTGAVWGSTVTSIFGSGSVTSVTGASTSVAFFPAYTLSGGATKRVRVQAATTGNTGGLANFTASTGSTTGTQAQWSIANDTAGSFGSTVYNAMCWGDGDTACTAAGGAFNLETKVLPIYGPSLKY